MKKWIFVLGLVLSFNANAETMTQGVCGTGCSWIKNGTKLTITAENGAVMDDFEELEDERGCYTSAPWGTDFTEVEFIGSISNISNNAFQGSSIEQITIPNSVTSIGVNAFSWTENLSSVNIPNSVTSIGKWAFAKVGNLTDIVLPVSVTTIADRVFSLSYNLQNIVIENPNAVLQEDALITFLGNIYCQSLDQCSGKGIDDEKIKIYTKEGNDIDGYLYKVGDDYFASRDLMINNIKCDNKKQCESLLASAQNGIFSFNGKFYESLNDLAHHEHIKKRIYTIEEANQVAGKTNSFKIKYR